MYVSAELIIAASRQASIKPTRPRFSGPRISLRRRPKRDRDRPRFRSFPQAVPSAIRAVNAHPTVHSRFKKLPTTRPIRASSSDLAEPPPVAMKCGWTTIPTIAQQRQRNDVLDWELTAARAGKQTEVVRRNTLVHDAKTVHQTLLRPDRRTVPPRSTSP